MLDQSLGGSEHSGMGWEEPVMVIRTSIFEAWLKTWLKVGVKIVKYEIAQKPNRAESDLLVPSMGRLSMSSGVAQIQVFLNLSTENIQKDLYILSLLFKN